MKSNAIIIASDPKSPAGLKGITLWIGIALVACHVIKTGLFVAAGQPPLNGDSVHYWLDANRISSGDWFMADGDVEVVRTPGYPAFLALFQTLFGSRALIAATVAQEIVVLLTALMTAWLCRRVTGSSTGMLVGLALSLFCISQNGLALRPVSDTMLCFTLTATLAGLIVWIEQPSLLKATAIGMALGVLILIKPIGQLAWIPVLAIMLFRLRGMQMVRKFAVHAMCMMLAVGLLVAPWLVRNRIYCGQYFLTKAMGRTLWWSCLQNRPDHVIVPDVPFANGPATAKVRQILQCNELSGDMNVPKMLRNRGLSETEADSLLTRMCVEAVKAHPWPYFAGRVPRFGWFWLTPNGTARPCTGVSRSVAMLPSDEQGYTEQAGDTYMNQKWWRSDWYYERGLLNNIWYPHPLLYGLAALATTAGLIYMIRTPRLRDIGVACGLLLLYFSSVTIMTAGPEYRYRMILEPMMIVVVTPGIVKILERFSTKPTIRVQLA